MVSAAWGFRIQAEEIDPTLREDAQMRTETRAWISRLGALAIGTATLAVAGCGGSGSPSSSPASPASMPATSTSQTSSAADSLATRFNAGTAALLDTYDAAVRQYNVACCQGTNYDAEASAVRAYQAAGTTFTDGLARLTPPPSAAVALQTYIASVRGDLANSGEVLTAVLAHDPAAIRAAIHAGAASTAGYTATYNALLVALGVHGSDVVGYWDGFVTQHGPGTTTQRYFVEMTVKSSTPGATAGTTNYPDLHCSGQLQLSRAQGILHVYHEQITSGGQQCGSGGTIYATVLGGSMSWRWIATGIVVLGYLDHLQRPGY
jgi:hypothetical protein